MTFLLQPHCPTCLLLSLLDKIGPTNIDLRLDCYVPIVPQTSDYEESFGPQTTVMQV